jgi:methyl-accepting chemotaxis protein
MLAMLLLVIFSSKSLEKDISMAKDIGKIETNILQLRRSEKDFLARKELKYLDSFKQVVKTLELDFNHLSANVETIDIDQTGLNNLRAIVSDNISLTLASDSVVTFKLDANDIVMTTLNVMATDVNL